MNKMSDKEFIKFSEEKVMDLNGSKIEESFEAWRDGVNEAKRFVRSMMNSCDMTEFIDKMEEFSEKEFETFKFNLKNNEDRFN